MKKSIILVFLIFMLSCTGSQPVDAPHPRIVVLSPELAEIICVLGAEEHITGIVLECDYPNELHEKNSVGSFSSPSIEKIAALEPDAVLCTGMEQEILSHQLDKLGMEVFRFFPSSLTSLYETIVSVGELLHHNQEADSLVQYMQQKIEKISKLTNKPSVYIEIYNKPLMSASSGSFVGDLLRATGLENIFPELPREYCAVSSENIVKLDPDIIIITYPNATKKDITSRLGWQTISAVKTNNIYTTEDIDPDLLLRAGPRVVQGIQKLSELSKQNE